MQALAERLKEQIRASGPMPFRDWMWAALYDPESGYYNRSDLQRWGREADYRTSP
jgi:SAM-dependent MidA family methyltransferase